MTIMKGADMTTMACSRAVSPPASSSTAAATAETMPQNAVSSRGGFADPREHRMPITTEAASAPLTNHSTMSTITMTALISASGNWSSSANNTDSWLTSTAETISVAVSAQG